MRISDWSSDVCSSDLSAITDAGTALARRLAHDPARLRARGADHAGRQLHPDRQPRQPDRGRARRERRREARLPGADRKSVVCGKSVSVRVDLGGARQLKKKKKQLRKTKQSTQV